MTILPKEVDLTGMDGIIVPVNARGITTGSAMSLIAREFPTSFEQYRQLCSRSTFKGDATGRTRKRRMVEPGDVMHFVDLTSEDYSRLILQVTKEEITEEDMKEAYDEAKKHVFLMVVRGRADKPFNVKKLNRMLGRVQDDMHRGAKLAMLMWDNPTYFEAAEAAIAEVITDIHIALL